MDIIEMNKKAWDNIGSKIIGSIKSDKYKEMFELFCHRLPEKANVLDLGCGAGTLTKDLLGRGFIVTALDISETMIKEARKNAPDAKYVRKSMTEMEFRNEFDGILSSFTMLLLDPENFRETAKRISNALKIGGIFLLILNEPSPKGHDEEESIIEIMGQKIYSRVYTENGIKDIFERYGMSIIRTERKKVISEEYGEEYTLLVLMQKD